MFRDPLKKQKPTVVGNLDIVEVIDERLPTGYQKRNVRVWTPKNYDENKSYPVIYFQDGQNIFDSLTSFAGEWEADETMTEIMEEFNFNGAILVGIDNTNDRLNKIPPKY